MYQKLKRQHWEAYKEGIFEKKMLKPNAILTYNTEKNNKQKLSKNIALLKINIPNDVAFWDI